MSFSNYWENVILDDILNDTIYVGLSTADPGEDASTLAEPSGNGYARVSVTADDWDAASGGSKANGNAITFPTASGSWGTITHVCFHSTMVETNLLASAALDSSQAISTNQILEFAAGDLAVTLG